MVTRSPDETCANPTDVPETVTVVNPEDGTEFGKIEDAVGA
jgi:hypothetical protein